MVGRLAHRKKINQGMKVPTLSTLEHPAPKRARLRKGMVGLTLPPGALKIVDGLVGTYVGSTRSEVLRFIVISWIVEHPISHA